MLLNACSIHNVHDLVIYTLRGIKNETMEIIIQPKCYVRYKYTHQKNKQTNMCFTISNFSSGAIIRPQCYIVLIMWIMITRSI